MKLITKTPNLALPRVQVKCKALLDLVDELDLYGPRQITQAELTRLLGNQTKPLGAYLRLGLERFGSYNKETGKSFSYRPNHEFCNKLRDKLSTPPTPILEVAKKVNLTFSPFKRQDFKKTGHRYYPWWSWMKSSKLEALFLAQHGQMFRYDIEASQPTIVLQLYERLLNPLQQKYSSKHKVSTWRAYVDDRTSFRMTLANDLNLSYDEVKDILSGITNGSYATTSPKNPICMRLGVIDTGRLISHPLYVGLLTDYRTIRSVLFPGEPIKGISKLLYNTYEKIEDHIMQFISEIIKVDAWFIHDGFFTHTQINKADIEEQVQKTLNFKIKLDEK